MKAKANIRLSHTEGSVADEDKEKVRRRAEVEKEKGFAEGGITGKAV